MALRERRADTDQTQSVTQGSHVTGSRAPVWGVSIGIALAGCIVWRTASGSLHGDDIAVHEPLEPSILATLPQSSSGSELLPLRQARFDPFVFQQQGPVLEGSVPKPSIRGRKDRRFTLLRAAAQIPAAELRALAEQLPDSYGKHLDEVDGQPAHELYLLGGGEPLQPDAKLGAQLQNALHAVVAALLPRIRSYGADAVPCTAFLRRYRPGERRLNPTHFDMEAFVTVVLSLSNASEFAGGLYVQSTDASSRRLLPMDMGDVLLHQYDLNHGVAVAESGTRHSLVLWVSSSTRACSEESSEWYSAAAEQGDADAQWNLAHLHKRGVRGFPKDPKAALHWYRQSASQGHSGAMNNLALMLEDRGDAAAESWFRRSAELGEVTGQLNWAACLNARGLREQAAFWNLRAARQSNPKAMVAVAKALQSGRGLPRNASVAGLWLQEAASLGYGPAFHAIYDTESSQGRIGEALQALMKGAKAEDLDCMVSLGELYRDGRGLPKSKPKAAMWLKKAAMMDAENERVQALKLSLG